MSESVYKVIDLIGSSSTSWEKAAENAIESAGLSIRDMRIAEVKKLDMKLDGEKGLCYRARLEVSFKILSE